MSPCPHLPATVMDTCAYPQPCTWFPENPGYPSREQRGFEQFLREYKAFQLDRAHDYTSENRLGEMVVDLRQRLDEMLGDINLYVAVLPPCTPLSSLCFLMRRNLYPLPPRLLNRLRLHHQRYVSLRILDK